MGRNGNTKYIFEAVITSEIKGAYRSRLDADLESTIVEILKEHGIITVEITGGKYKSTDGLRKAQKLQLTLSSYFSHQTQQRHSTHFWDIVKH